MIPGVHTWGWESWGPPRILPILVIVVLEPMGMNCGKIRKLEIEEFQKGKCGILLCSPAITSSDLLKGNENRSTKIFLCE